MNTVTKLIVAMSLFGVSMPVFADDVTSVPNPASGQGIEKRVERQEKRIDRKLKNKKITEGEASKLKNDVQAIKQKEQEMKKEGNGQLSREQKKELHGELKKTSQEIKAAGSPASGQ